MGIERFVRGHEYSYETALAEIRAGKKSSHWIWYIFPQIHGLGVSAVSREYSICCAEEAKAYMEHP